MSWSGWGWSAWGWSRGIPDNWSWSGGSWWDNASDKSWDSWSQGPWSQDWSQSGGGSAASSSCGWAAEPRKQKSKLAKAADGGRGGEDDWASPQEALLHQAVEDISGELREDIHFKVYRFFRKALKETTLQFNAEPFKTPHDLASAFLSDWICDAYSRCLQAWYNNPKVFSQDMCLELGLAICAKPGILRESIGAVASEVVQRNPPKIRLTKTISETFDLYCPKYTIGHLGRGISSVERIIGHRKARPATAAHPEPWGLDGLGLDAGGSSGAAVAAVAAGDSGRRGYAAGGDGGGQVAVVPPVSAAAGAAVGTQEGEGSPEWTHFSSPGGPAAAAVAAPPAAHVGADPAGDLDLADLRRVLRLSP